MEIEFTQDVYYSNKKKIPLSEVAKSLLALEQASSIAPELIERLFDDISVRNMSIYVDELETGSLKEKIQYYLTVGFQKNISELTGVEYTNIETASSEKQKQILGWAIAAGLIFSFKVASDKAFPNQEKPNIENQINITIQAGRDVTGLDAEELISAVEGVVRDNPRAVKGAVDFASPAKKEQGAYLSLDRETTFSPELLAEVPGGVIDEEERERVLELENEDIFIRATDKDSSKKGWGATIPAFSEKRLRMHIAPGLDLTFLSHMDIVVGDVSIFYRILSDGTIVRPHAHLYAVDKEATLKRNGKLD